MAGPILLNLDTERPLATEVRIAASMAQRLRGLLGRSSLNRGEALFLPGCRSVHTLFMAFSLDLLFVDAENRILKMISTLPPFRLAFGPLTAAGVWELEAGALERAGCQPGHRLSLEERG